MSMKYFSYFTVLGIVSFIGLLILLSENPHTYDQPIVSKPTATTNVDAFNKTDRSTIETSTVPHEYSVVNTTNNEAQYLNRITTQAISSFKTDMRQIFLVGRNINRTKLREEIFNNMASSPEIVEIAANIPGNVELSESLFNQEQAQARVASIMLLEHLAKQGDTIPLERAIQRTVATLEKKDWVKGIEHDYSDMVVSYFSNYIEKYGLNNFVNDIGLVLENIKLSSTTMEQTILSLGLSPFNEIADPAQTSTVHKAIVDMTNGI